MAYTHDGSLFFPMHTLNRTAVDLFRQSIEVRVSVYPWTLGTSPLLSGLAFLRLSDSVVLQGVGAMRVVVGREIERAAADGLRRVGCHPHPSPPPSKGEGEVIEAAEKMLLPP